MSIFSELCESMYKLFIHIIYISRIKFVFKTNILAKIHELARSCQDLAKEKFCQDFV